MADLKSVKARAWRQLTLPDNIYLQNILLLYKADITNNKLYIQAGGELLRSSNPILDTTDCQLIDLSSIVDTFGDNSNTGFDTSNIGYVTGINGNPIAITQGTNATTVNLSAYISNKYISVNGTGFNEGSGSSFNFEYFENILLTDGDSGLPYITINVTKFADGII
jgi:hypothetical protein